MSHPTALFNSSALEVVLPSSPSLVSSAPPSTTFASLSNEAECARTDAWVSRLAGGAQRTTLYYDERLAAFAVIALPTSASLALSRAQAAALFLRSLPQPHISLTADLHAQSSDVQHIFTHQDSLQKQQAAPPLPPRHSSVNALAAKVPLTPAPFPATLPGEGEDGRTNAATLGVPAASVAYEEGGRRWVARDAEERWVGVWEVELTIPFVRSPLAEPKLSFTVTITLRDDPRLNQVFERAKHGVLPKDGGEDPDVLDEEDEDDEYMEDSYEDVNLLASLSPISTKPLHLPFSRLPSAYLPSLPTAPSAPTHRSSRSRSYSLTSDATPFYPSLRRSCRRVLPVQSAIQLQMRTIPCPVGALGVPEGGHVWSRDNEDGVVLCLELSGPSLSSSARSSGEEGFELESIEVSLEGGATAGGALGARESHDVEVRELRTAGLDLPLRIAADGSEQYNFLYALASIPTADGPLSLTGGREGNEPLDTVPIAVATSPSQRFTARYGAEEVSEQAAAQAVGEIALRRGSLPLGMLSEEGPDGEAEWGRNVAIVVKGRPYGKKRDMDREGKENGGYEVTDAVKAENEAEETAMKGKLGADDLIFATTSFCSRWNCTLDISAFARRPPPRLTSFHPPALVIARPASIGGIPSLPPPPPRSAGTARASFAPPFAPPLSAPPSRPSSLPVNIEYESVAGSKRHTMSSLSSLSLKSPVINRRGSVFSSLAGAARFAPPHPHPEAQGGRRPSRALPPTPMSPPAPASTFTSAATGPPKRFFSLPGTDSSAAGLPHNHPIAAVVGAPVRTETPSPMSAGQLTGISTLQGGESSSTLLSAGIDRPKDNRRTSWMSSLVGGSTGSVAGSPTGPPARASSLNAATSSSTGGPGTSWDRPSLPTRGLTNVGLGLDETVAVPAAAVPPSSFPPPTSQQRQSFPLPVQQQQQTAGKLLISVSLVPLRQATSRRQKPAFDGSAPAATTGRTNENLPPATLPGLAPPSPNPSSSLQGTPRTTFSFPPPSPDSSSSSSSGANTPALQPLTPSSPVDPSAPNTGASLPSFKALAERTNLSTSRMPRVNLLDVFLVEVFVSNQSERVKRFTVGVPPAPRGEEKKVGATGVRGKKEERVATLVPLENDVRIGPLAPNTCASVGIRFLALSPGAHYVDQIRLLDLADGTETRLEKAVWVVVE
ncbi:hypothetical protein JCM11251_001013 [Rhodosporidiobolus azoricus]